MGLLLLRMAVGGALWWREIEGNWMAGLMLLCVASVVLGLLARWGSVVGGLLVLARGAGGPPEAALIEALTTGALVLLGPGAYSGDARLFGRREVIIPEWTRKKKGNST